MTPMQPDDPHAAGWTINTLRVYLESRLETPAIDSTVAKG